MGLKNKMTSGEYASLKNLANNDVDLLRLKRDIYGDSWKERGGVGAFMMLARKWDRINLAAEDNGWDIFKAMDSATALLEDIQDLRCYLLLVHQESLIRRKNEQRNEAETARRAIIHSDSIECAVCYKTYPTIYAFSRHICEIDEEGGPTNAYVNQD